MKRISILQLFLLSLLITTAFSLGMMRRRNRKVDVLPSEYQTSEAATGKALKQTLAARKLFYLPGQVAIDELKKAATNLQSIVTFMKESVYTNTDFNRAFSNGVFNFMSQLDVEGAIGRVLTGRGTGKDNIGVLAIMGDIGTALMDYVPGATDSKNLAFKTLVTKMRTIQSKTETEFNAQSAQIKNARGGSVLCPSKKIDRATYAVPQGTSAFRGGVFDLSERADTQLSIVSDASGKIPKCKWPWQTVPSTTIDNCNNEPWAGHLSGSIVEVFYVFDLLTGEDPLKSFGSVSLSNLQNKQRDVKAALAAAFLVGLGYHSAVEVEITVRAYLGKNPLALTANPNHLACSKESSDQDKAECRRICAANVALICANDRNPTNWISHLMEKFTEGYTKPKKT